MREILEFERGPSSILHQALRSVSTQENDPGLPNDSVLQGGSYGLGDALPRPFLTWGMGGEDQEAQGTQMLKLGVAAKPGSPAFGEEHL